MLRSDIDNFRSDINELGEALRLYDMTSIADEIQEDGDYTYFGYAKPGSDDDTSLAVWSIKRIEEGAVVGRTSTRYAEGTFNYDQVFDDYATLDYLIKKF